MAVYYFRPGTEAFKTKGVIYLQGGGSCQDEASCVARQEDDFDLTSSLDTEPDLRDFGILSTTPSDNPDFFGWNHVKLAYCSSDLWVGDTSVLIGTQTWEFRGRNIVEAVIEDLRDPGITLTSNLGDATDVVFAGSSVGGAGALEHLDRVAGTLPDARVVGLVDSYWFFELEPYDPLYTAEDLADFVQAGQVFQNRTYDDSCVAALGDEGYLCAYQSIVYPYIETPAFVFVNHRDLVLLQTLGVSTPQTPEETAWIDTVYRPALVQSFVVIGADHGLYSPDEAFHTALTDTPRFTDPYIGDESLASVFGNWYFVRAGVTRLVEELPATAP